MQSSETLSPAGTSLETSRGSRVKILLVDDTPENLISLEAALETLGEELVSAHSGRDALRHLLEDDFAAILLDVKMPDMDGFETAELIRSRPRSRQPTWSDAGRDFGPTTAGSLIFAAQLPGAALG